MKTLYSTLFVLSFLFLGQQAAAQELWTGFKFTFTKGPGNNWNLEAYQDRITDSVWLVRANSQGLFNIRQEPSFQGGGSPPNFGPSPVGTEWAFGTIADGVENLTFMTWTESTTVNDPGGLTNPSSLIDQDMVLHLTAEDIYIDIKFLSWGIGTQGGMGAYSYERSTRNISDAKDLGFKANSLTVFPNPTNGYLFIQDLEETQSVEIFNLQGQRVYQRVINASDEIDISSLPTGTYLLRAESGKTATFIKE